MTPTLAIASSCLLDVDAPAVVNAAATAGFDALGLRLSGEHRLDDRGIAEVCHRLDDTDIWVLDAEVHRIGTPLPDGPTLSELIDTAAAVGARRLLVVSDLPDLDATIDALGAVVEQCAAVGIGAAIEYMAWTTPNTPGDAIAVSLATGAGIVLDVLHHVRVGAGTTEIDDIVSSGHLGWVQVSDAPSAQPADLLWEARHGRRLPGEGELPLTELLARIPVDTPISAEVTSDVLRRDLPPIERARDIGTALRRHWGR